MATALNLIQGAMGLLQVLNPGALTASETQDGLDSLNEMLASWANDPLNIYKVTNENFVSTGNQVITMGPGGDWDTDRPIKIQAVTARIATNLDRPVEILNYSDYLTIRIKNLATNYPNYIYPDGGYPLQNLYVYPVPSSGMTFTVWSIKPLAEFASIEDAVSLPPGYIRAIKYNLATTMAPMFQVAAGPDVQRIATTSLKQIQRTNTRVPTMQSDPALLTRRGNLYNVYSDGWGPAR